MMQLQKISRYILLALISTFLYASIAFGQSPTQAKNYIIETTVKTPNIKTTSQLNGLIVDSANRSIKYFDGLGRPSQVVQWQASPTKKDIVQIIEFDLLDREAKKYMLYAEQTSNDGSYKASGLSNQATFYNSVTGWDPATVKTPYPFSQTLFEPSPINRVLEQGAEGAAWQPASSRTNTSGRTIVKDQGTNVYFEIPLWTINNNGNGASSNTNTYNTNKLVREVTKDENWISGKAGTTEVFKDNDDKIVLKKVWESENSALSTQYIYDDRGNLRYILPPAITTSSFTESDNMFNQYAFAYHYDGRNRLIEKKIPGKGWEHIVYNKYDQIVLTQDSVQRINNQWSFIKYDVMRREVMTGIVNSSANRSAWQNDINNQTNLWENRESNGGTDYSNLTLPLSNIQLYTINYYDNYDFRNMGNTYPPNVTASLKTKGLQTGARIWTTDGLSSNWRIIYYDDDAHELETISQNHLGGTDRTVNSYNFAGEIVNTVRTHVGNNTTTTIANNYTYDHSGRKKENRQNINNQGEIIISRLIYNEIGQLKEKALNASSSQGPLQSSITLDGADVLLNGQSRTVNASNSIILAPGFEAREGSFFAAGIVDAPYLQKIEYTYNERGWLKSSTSDLFSIQLKYNDAEAGTTPNFNGNISNQLWGSGSNFPNIYKYAYDNLNRVIEGTTTSGIAMSETIAYDKMGNILRLNRTDNITPKSGTYNLSGNQLINITNGALATGNYSYDGNGNTTIDGRNGVAIGYNLLNLPSTVSKAGLSLSYIYDATGKKLRKINSSSATTTDYVDGIQYNNGTIDFIQTEEGIARNNNGTFVYEYNLIDHLGNVRSTFNKHPLTGTTQQLQADNYYAFGQRNVLMAGNNNYLYNKKELQNELEQYDYGARFYDPVIGRFTTIDPSADEEEQESDSPYGYVANNPISRVDPDGKIWGQIIGAVVGAGAELATQMIANRLSGKKQDIDWKAVGLSALEGALTSGGSAVRKLAIKGGIALAKSTLDYAKDHKIQGAKDVLNIAKNAGIDMLADKASGALGKVAKAGVDKATGKVVSKALDKLATKITPSRTKVAKLLQGTGLNSRVRSAIGKDIREGQKVLGKNLRESVNKSAEAYSKGKADSKIKAVKDKTNL